MLSNIPQSVKIAGAIFITLLVYFIIRTAIGQDNNAKTIVAPASVESVMPTVAITPLRAEIHPVIRSFKGRTEADRTVTIRAETPGSVRSAPVEDGTRVSEGDLLCGLNIDAREARLAEAKATVEASRIDFNAVESLSESGFSSSNRLATAKAAMDRAEAALNSAKIELDRTQLRAPFDGVFEERLANVGDYLRGGDKCGTVVDLDPIIIAANVSEDMVANLKLGATALVKLSDGREFNGKLSFISRTADPRTRTFRIETEVVNSDYAISAGLTSEVLLTMGEEKAILVSAASLALNDEGIVGIRYVDRSNLVHFAKVNTIDDSANGIWVTGLPDKVNIISVGQDFIREGTRVKTVWASGQ